MQNDVQSDKFTSAYSGLFYGIVSEEAYIQMADLAARSDDKHPSEKEIEQAEEWFALETARDGFQIFKFAPEEVRQKLMDILAEVKARKSLSGSCPYTYVQDRSHPQFIKLYDPLRSGGCGSQTAPDPWWVFSTITPEKIEIESLFGHLKKKKNFFFKNL